MTHFARVVWRLATGPVQSRFSTTIDYSIAPVRKRARMHSIDFSQYDLECSKYERFHHPDPRVARRMEIRSLKAAGFRHRDIAKAAGVSRSTIGRLLNLFVEAGLEGVREFHEQGPTSAPAEHAVSLSEEFRLRQPGDVATEELEDFRDNAFGILPHDGSSWVNTILLLTA